MNVFGRRRTGRARNAMPRSAAFLIGLLAALSATPAASDVPIQSGPLSLGNNVPNNLVLIPSVEFPTLVSQANFDMVNNVDTYNPARAYVGYFDPDECYEYVYDASEPLRYFKPVVVSVNHVCVAGTKQWSGNFMNWAVTQTIDPFRKSLTGGYRVRDTPTETWLEKAANPPGWGNTAYFSNKDVAATQVQGVTPATTSYPIKMRVYGLRNQMYFTRNETPSSETNNTPDYRLTSGTPIPYDPANHNLNGANPQGSGIDTRLYAVSVRVAVCVDSGSVKPEANCKKYSNGWKPEGLIQKYQDRLRYSIFGYLSDNSVLRDGGILRARQKYVGPYSYDPVQGPIGNPNKEWDPVTGVHVVNPDAADADATNANNNTNVVTNSGVINYLNKFGQTSTSPPKGYDNVSELYYAAVRYLKAQSNVPEYTNIPAGQAVVQTDLFPVITNWSPNPVQFRCQRNIAVGIGDAYTWADRNLPGSTTTRPQEPAMPAAVAADNTINVETVLQKVFDLEGIKQFTGSGAYSIPSQGHSAFIAALAYDSHTKDMQPAMPDLQTLSTYWVDVLPFRVVRPRADNQYYLAAKYGGFDVPAGYDPVTRTVALPDAWWTDGDLVGLADQQNEKRPRNFYVAYQAEQMMTGLTRAFENAVSLRVGAAGGLGTNGATLEDGASVYVPTFFTDWHGDLTSYRLDPTSKTYILNWSASAGVPAPADRKIYANSDGYRAFSYDLLSGNDRTNLGSGNFSGASGQDVLNYLRGDRSKEVARGGPLRNRSGVLGDFVDSTPIYVGKPSPDHYAYSTFLGGGKAYTDFAAAKAARTPTVYVGGNDGMLHGFNANTGVETYAFVPQAVLKIPGGLTGYASPNYQHRYFVDGELTVADVYIGGGWKTILVGTMGRGGNGVFALDVTDPNDIKFLWEKYGSDIPALGNNLGKPVVAQTGNGVWKVLLGNGPNSAGGQSQLLTLDIATGATTTTVAGAGPDNGLSGVRAWDSDNDGFADSAYAGDFAGNLWKFDNLGGSATVTRLFTATDSGGKAQPITAAPLVGRKPDSIETWVFFGTGRFLGGTDLGDKSPQAWYGVMDKNVEIFKSQLINRKIELEGTLKDQNGKDVDIRVISAAKNGDMENKAGWYIDLVPPSGTVLGERMVTPNLFDGNRLLGISRIPDVSDPCAVAGDGWIMEIDPFTGARLNGGIFDVNGDGSIDSKDYPPGSGDGSDPVPPSGVGTKGLLNPGLIIPGKNGNIVTGTNQNGETSTQPTAVTGLGAKRVAWREVLRDG